MATLDAGSRCRVIVRHDPAAQTPIVVHRGDALVVGREDDEWPGWLWCTAADGVAGWVPVPYIENCNTGHVGACDHDSTALSLADRDQVTVDREINVHGWCSTDDGRHGWAPTRNLAPV